MRAKQSQVVALTFVLQQILTNHVRNNSILIGKAAVCWVRTLKSTNGPILTDLLSTLELATIIRPIGVNRRRPPLTIILSMSALVWQYSYVAYRPNSMLNPRSTDIITTSKNAVKPFNLITRIDMITLNRKSFILMSTSGCDIKLTENI